MLEHDFLGVNDIFTASNLNIQKATF